MMKELEEFKKKIDFKPKRLRLRNIVDSGATTTRHNIQRRFSTINPWSSKTSSLINSRSNSPTSNKRVKNP